MANFTKVLGKADLPVGSMKSVFVKGKRLAMANVDGTIFAVDDACTHTGCSLGSEGTLKGKIITCTCHGSKFDVGSGKVLSPPAVINLSSYMVKVDGEDILVNL